MKRLLFGILGLALLSSCDDGEIVVTDFDFEDSSIQFCEGPDKNVFYAINNDGIFESISLEFSNNQLAVDENGNLEAPDPIDEEISFALDDQNDRIVYRLYNGDIPTGSNGYFCNVVPPSSPVVVEEWISGSGATARITSRYTDETADADPDRDGLENSEEGWDPDGEDHQDTDNDGIPDYLDFDDDGDNVRTIVELANGSTNPDPVNDDGLRDTDEDGVPNYLDDDDDGDGVLTRLEVDEDDLLNPTQFSSTGDEIANFLNDEQVSQIQHDEYIEHRLTRSFGFRIVIDNLQLSQTVSGATQRFGQTFVFGAYNGGSSSETLCPDQDPTCGETEEEEEEEEEDENQNPS